MKLSILSLLLLLSIGNTTPISPIPENRYNLNDNVIYWAYASEDQQYGLIYKFIIAGNGALVLKRKPEDSPYDELSKMKKCMDDTYNDVWLEFDRDIQIGVVMCACASRLGWMN